VDGRREAISNTLKRTVMEGDEEVSARPLIRAGRGVCPRPQMRSADALVMAIHSAAHLEFRTSQTPYPISERPLSNNGCSFLPSSLG